VSNCYDLLRAENRFGAAKRTAAVFDPLHNVIETLKVLPDKSTDAWVGGNALLGTVGKYIPPLGSSDRDVVDVRNCGVGDFGLEDMGDVVMEYGDGVGPAHGQGNESECAKRRLECGEVARRLCQAALIITNVQVEHPAARATSKMLAYLIRERSNPRMFNSNAVKRLETVNKPKRLPVLLNHTKPARPVRRVRRLINARIDLDFNKSADLLVDARRDRDISLSPRLMRNSRDLDGREEVLSEMPVLWVCPGESRILHAHEVMHERAFLRQ
jgi:hypothetical protein